MYVAEGEDRLIGIDDELPGTAAVTEFSVVEAGVDGTRTGRDRELSCPPVLLEASDLPELVLTLLLLGDRASTTPSKDELAERLIDGTSSGEPFHRLLRSCVDREDAVRRVATRETPPSDGPEVVEFLDEMEGVESDMSIEWGWPKLNESAGG